MGGSVKSRQRQELSDFLRTRRARIQPSAVGLRLGTRRRTPGLRREEVALLAGVGESWYTWLEQGRDIRVSAEVLDSISNVLKLDQAERQHLFSLAGVQPPLMLTPDVNYLNMVIQNILDAFGIYPAYAINQRWDILSWNESASRVFANFGELVKQERNILWFVFTHPLQQQMLPDWEKEARTVLALFRAATQNYVQEEWYSQLVSELKKRSVEFSEWWNLHDVQAVHRDYKELNHPLVGRLVLRPTTLLLPEAPNVRVMVYMPLGEADTATKLARLVNMQQHLRYTAS